MSFPNLNKTMEAQQNLWKNKKWNGPTWLCSIFMRTFLQQYIYRLAIYFFHKNYSGSVKLCDLENLITTSASMNTKYGWLMSASVWPLNMNSYVIWPLPIIIALYYTWGSCQKRQAICELPFYASNESVLQEDSWNEIRLREFWTSISEERKRGNLEVCMFCLQIFMPTSSIAFLVTFLLVLFACSK